MSEKKTSILKAKVVQMIDDTTNLLASFDTVILSSQIYALHVSILNRAVSVEKNYNKKNQLKQIDSEVETLRQLVKVAYNAAYISEPELLAWSLQCDELGRLVGSQLNKMEGEHD